MTPTSRPGEAIRDPVLPLIRPSVAKNIQWTNYVGCQNDAEAPIDKDNHGVFFLNSAVRTIDISDGMSHTLFIGEKIIDPAKDLGWMSGTRSTLRNVGSAHQYRPPEASQQRIDRGMASSNRSSSRWTKTPRQRPAPVDPLLFVGGFGSDHAGSIVNMALGDSSVRALSENIAPAVLKQLAHRADGELPSSEETKW